MDTEVYGAVELCVYCVFPFEGDDWIVNLDNVVKGFVYLVEVLVDSPPHMSKIFEVCLFWSHTHVAFGWKIAWPDTVVLDGYKTLQFRFVLRTQALLRVKSPGDLKE